MRLISARYLLYVVAIGGAVLILLVLAALGFDLVRDRGEILASAEHNNENLVHVLAEQTARTVQAIDVTLADVGDALTHGRVSGAAGSREVLEFLRQARAPAPFIQALFVTDARGIAIHSSESLPTTPLDLADRSYFTRQRDDPRLGLYIGPPIMSRAFGRWFISMSRRLTTSDGRFAGVVGAAVEPRYFQDVYDALRVGKNGSVVMFLRDGTLMVRSPHIESAVGTSFARLPLFRAGLPAGAAGSMRTAGAIDGVARLLSYRTVPDRPLVVFVSTSQTETLTPWRRRVVAEAIAALVFVGMMAGLTTMLARQIRNLGDSEERFRSLFEHSPDALLLATPDGQILDASPAAERLFGLTAAQLRAQGRAPRVEANDPRFADVLEEHERTGRFDGELDLRRGDGSMFPAHVTTSGFRDNRGARRTVLIIRDVSERRRLEEELACQQALARQQERLAEMGRLLSGVAHELNNPLAVILGRAELLKRMPGDTAAARHVRPITESAQRCAHIVKSFLALAREYPPEMGRVALNAIVRETVELLGYQLRVESITVALELAADLPDLLADPHQLQQVLVNLVTNAFHALRTTPQPRRLTLVTRHDAPGGRVILEVRDTGPGIPESVQTRLFEPFVTTKPVGEGTGLGLSICKGIVESHGGTISVESVAGEGTTFRLELPIRPAPAPEPAAAVPGTAGGELSVLVIDDEPEVASVLAETLATRGHRVDTAENGAAALAKLQARAYDVIFCDLKMPVMDGEQFYATLVREQPGLARCLVFLTGDTFSPATPAFLAKAGRPFIAKPFSEDAIWRAVADLTARESDGAA